MRKNNSTISKSQQFPYNRNNAFMSILLGGILVACMMYFILRNPAWAFYVIIVFLVVVCGFYHMMKGLISLIRYTKKDSSHRQDYCTALFVGIFIVVIDFILTVSTTIIIFRWYTNS